MTEWAGRLYSRFPWRGLERWLRGGECAILCDEPLVLYAYDWALFSDDAALRPVLLRHRRQRSYLLFAFSWYHEEPAHVQKILHWHAEHQRRYPLQQVVFLANTRRQHAVLSQAGLRSALVSSNALVDATSFRPLPEVARRFAAIYDARIAAFKRHELARDVQGLALLTARNEQHRDLALERRMRELLAAAHWYNDPGSPHYRSFGAAEVNACLAESRVGLCLSAEEGAMFASIQYLLAGMPVVSTASRGGRDEFFDADYVAVVPDDPQSIAQAVRRMQHCEVAAGEIRRRTLERMQQHRERLFALLGEILRSEGRSDVDPQRTLPWHDVGRNHLRVAPQRLFERIGTCGSAR